MDSLAACSHPVQSAGSAQKRYYIFPLHSIFIVIVVDTIAILLFSYKAAYRQRRWTPTVIINYSRSTSRPSHGKQLNKSSCIANNRGSRVLCSCRAVGVVVVVVVEILVVEVGIEAAGVVGEGGVVGSLSSSSGRRSKDSSSSKSRRSRSRSSRVVSRRSSSTRVVVGGG